MVDESFLGGFRDQLGSFKKLQVSWFESPDVVRVDLFLVASEYQRSAFTRRVPVALFGRQVWVMAAEDLILHKLIANRFKDLAAIEEICTAQKGRLDLDSLRTWAERLSLRNDLQRFLPG